MFQLLTVLCGMIIAAMVPLNGELAAVYGTFPGVTIVHLVGTALSAALCLRQKHTPPLWRQRPLWLYCGGAFGVLATACNSLAYGNISMTSIVALGLFGQTLASLAIDFFGLFGGKKQPFRLSSLISILFAGIGIAIMLDTSVRAAASAVLFSVLAGISLVITRMFNAALSEHVGALRCSFVNHAVGSVVAAAFAVIAILIGGLPVLSQSALRPWIYCGGMFGVFSVFISNIVVPKLSAFEVTIITFSSQILAGIAFDLVAGNGYSRASFYGGALVAFGILLSTLFEHFKKAQ